MALTLVDRLCGDNDAMPVVRITALPPPAGTDVSAVLRAVATELAELLGEEPQGSWAVWEPLVPGRYAEGHDTPDVQPFHTHPPLVRVIGFEGKEPMLVAAILERVASTLARELGLEPGNVFAVYEEAHAGRLFSGGRVV